MYCYKSKHIYKTKNCSKAVLKNSQSYDAVTKESYHSNQFIIEKICSYKNNYANIKNKKNR